MVDKAMLGIDAVVAIPGLVHGLFVLSILIRQPRWNQVLPQPPGRLEHSVENAPVSSRANLSPTLDA
jgi:hypothetical protein